LYEPGGEYLFLGLEKFDNGFITISGCGAWNMDSDPVRVISWPRYFMGALTDEMLDVREELGAGVPTIPLYASMGVD
jgi:hypothetical protein